MEFISYHVERPRKGKSLLSFPSDFTILDLETTGLDPGFDEIIEVACLRVRDFTVVDSFQSLIHPVDEIDEFITDLTGITNEMVANAPSINEVLPDVISFLSSDIVVGHNVNFDINFLYDALISFNGAEFSNDFLDTMRLARRMVPELSHHRLRDLITHFEIEPSGSHRALCDCESTLSVYLKLLGIASLSGDPNEYAKTIIRKKKSLDLREIVSTSDTKDPSNQLFGKHCVFTGTLEKMTRAEAAQIVVNIGGICDNGITKKTNFLILGNQDYRRVKEGKSTKQKKAESYKLDGIDIEIIPESVFYDLVLDS